MADPEKQPQPALGQERFKNRNSLQRRMPRSQAWSVLMRRAGGLFPRETSVPPQAAGRRYGAFAPLPGRGQNGLVGWQKEPQVSAFPAPAPPMDVPQPPDREGYTQPAFLHSNFWP